MLTLLSIALEAHNDELNRHRRYVVEVGRDLLGDWAVTIGYGRAGEPLRLMQFGSPDALAMQRVVREHLRRRLTAPRRIGCAYRLTSMNAARGFVATEWVSPAMLGRLLVEDAPPEVRRSTW